MVAEYREYMEQRQEGRERETDRESETNIFGAVLGNAEKTRYGGMARDRDETWETGYS